MTEHAEQKSKEKKKRKVSVSGKRSYGPISLTLILTVTMSDLYRSAMSARIAKLREFPHVEADEDEESADSLGSLPGSGLGPPALPAHTRRNKQKRAPNPEFSPISASAFFVDAAQVEVPTRNLDCRVYYTPPKFADGTVMVCHHGAGYSGLSFACFAKEISDITKGECGVLALDARRHGKTTSSETDDDLSIDVLVEDFIQVIKTVFPDPQRAPTLLLVGHSMGGSVVVRSCPVFLDLKYKVAGVAVIDVVEGKWYCKKLYDLYSGRFCSRCSSTYEQPLECAA